MLLINMQIARYYLYTIVVYGKVARSNSVAIVHVLSSMANCIALPQVDQTYYTGME